MCMRRGHSFPRFLLGKGVAVAAKNKDGGTPLRGAAFLGHVEVVKPLLTAGADAGAF